MPPLPKPLLRGVLHQAGFSVSLVGGTLLIVGADGARRHVAAAAFAGSVAVCFRASALYHRVTWTPRLRLWMRRVDHAGVYLLIAGTYTPVCLLVLHGAWRPVVLVMVYLGAVAAIVLKVAWIRGAEVGRGSAWPCAGLRGRRHLAAARRAAESGRCRAPRGRRARVHGRRDHLRAAPAQPSSVRVWLPRALPCADARCRCLPVRRDRLLRHPLWLNGFSSEWIASRRRSILARWAPPFGDTKAAPLVRCYLSLVESDQRVDPPSA